LKLTVCGLAKVAIFTTNVDAENKTLINHKSVCGALNRQFLVGAVRRTCFISIDIVDLLIIDLHKLLVSKE